MVLTLQGKAKIANAISNGLIYGECGTSNAVPTLSDTDLGSPVTASIESLDVTTTDGLVTTTYELPYSDGNGNSYTEFAIQDGSGELVSRYVFKSIPKTSSSELTIKTQFLVR